MNEILTQEIINRMQNLTEAREKSKADVLVRTMHNQVVQDLIEELSEGNVNE